MIVDVDDPGTWPADVRAEAQAIADEVRGKTKHASDLPIPAELDDPFRARLAGHLLRAYHATRLLEHEVEMIRQQGLRPLTVDLVVDRTEAAHRNGCVTAEEREQLLGAHLFAPGQRRDRGYREDRVCLFLSQHPLREEPHLVAPLLRTWGGEAIYMTGAGRDLRPMLQQLGKPALVAANIDLGDQGRTDFVHPDVVRVFAIRLIDPKGQGADAFYLRPVPPQQVVGIWRPGDPEYDQFEGLPRE